jgi:hypothetical protein
MVIFHICHLSLADRETIRKQGKGHEEILMKILSTYFERIRIGFQIIGIPLSSIKGRLVIQSMTIRNDCEVELNYRLTVIHLHQTVKYNEDDIFAKLAIENVRTLTVPLYLDDLMAWNFSSVEGPSTVVTLTTVKPIPLPAAYPEYDRLVEDNRLSVVALFGQIKDGDLAADDPGLWSYETFRQSLIENGFTIAERDDPAVDVTLLKELSNGVVVGVDLIHPARLKKEGGVEEVGMTLRKMIQTRELIYYYGHSFHGGLAVLNQPDTFAKGRYQIMILDSCWTYQYYTTPAFKAKSTPDDPTGMTDLDIVNNSQKGYPGSITSFMAMFYPLLSSINGMDDLAGEGLSTWNELIERMNQESDLRHEKVKWESQKENAPPPEVYGVSGALSNQFHR